MSEHHAEVRWTRTSSDFGPDTYNRAHEIRFKHGTVVLQGDLAPQFKGEGKGADPEDQLVGALSTCHMLTFLAIASRKRLTVDAYEDEAVGVLEKDANGKYAITRVTLRPRVRFSTDVNVDNKTLDELHHRAHAGCFIANSVKADVSVEPRP